jgi:hypothetical protein
MFLFPVPRPFVRIGSLPRKSASILASASASTAYLPDRRTSVYCASDSPSVNSQNPLSESLNRPWVEVVSRIFANRRPPTDHLCKRRGQHATSASTSPLANRAAGKPVPESSRVVGLSANQARVGQAESDQGRSHVPATSSPAVDASPTRLELRCNVTPRDGESTRFTSNGPRPASTAVRPRSITCNANFDCRYVYRPGWNCVATPRRATAS